MQFCLFDFSVHGVLKDVLNSGELVLIETQFVKVSVLSLLHLGGVLLVGVGQQLLQAVSGNFLEIVVGVVLQIRIILSDLVHSL